MFRHSSMKNFMNTGLQNTVTSVFSRTCVVQSRQYIFRAVKIINGINNGENINFVELEIKINNYIPFIIISVI